MFRRIRSAVLLRFAGRDVVPADASLIRPGTGKVGNMPAVRMAAIISRLSTRRIDGSDLCKLDLNETASARPFPKCAAELAFRVSAFKSQSRTAVPTTQKVHSALRSRHCFDLLFAPMLPRHLALVSLRQPGDTTPAQLFILLPNLPSQIL